MTTTPTTQQKKLATLLLANEAAHPGHRTSENLEAGFLREGALHPAWRGTAPTFGEGAENELEKKTTGK